MGQGGQLDEMSGGREKSGGREGNGGREKRGVGAGKAAVGRNGVGGERGKGKALPIPYTFRPYFSCNSKLRRTSITQNLIRIGFLIYHKVHIEMHQCLPVPDSVYSRVMFTERSTH